MIYHRDAVVLRTQLTQNTFQDVRLSRLDEDALFILSKSLIREYLRMLV